MRLQIVDGASTGCWRLRRPGASPIDFSRLFGLLGETPSVVEVGSRRLLPDLEMPIASEDADA